MNGRIYLKTRNDQQGLDRVVRKEGAILTYYPTSTTSDVPIDVYLNRNADGSVRLEVKTAPFDRSGELLVAMDIPQPDSHHTSRDA